MAAAQAACGVVCVHGSVACGLHPIHRRGEISGSRTMGASTLRSHWYAFARMTLLTDDSSREMERWQVGLIRKSLMVGTGGIVSGSTKKQRVAKATMQHTKATAANTAQTNLILAQQAEAESEFRYSTDSVYRQYIDAQRAAATRAPAAEAARRAALSKQRVDASRAAGRYLALALAVAIAVVGVFVWSFQAISFTVRNNRGTYGSKTRSARLGAPLGVECWPRVRLGPNLIAKAIRAPA